MRSFDLSPLMRATVGFDRLASLVEASSRVDSATFSYPPYNIEKTGDDDYRITMAVAGFSEDELDVTVKDASLSISGKKAETEATDATYLHRGIATRSFERRFDLADHIRVVGAWIEHGQLHVDLRREVPEALKPRQIKIGTKVAPEPKVIESEAA